MKHQLYTLLFILTASLVSIGLINYADFEKEETSSKSSLATGISVTPSTQVDGETIVCGNATASFTVAAINPVITDTNPDPDCNLSNFYYDSNNDGVIQTGGDILLTNATSFMFSAGNGQDPANGNLNYGEHTVLYQDCQGVVGTTFRVADSPIIAFNNAIEDLSCTNTTSVNLTSFLAPGTTTGGVFTLTAQPGANAMIQGATLSFEGDEGAYTVNYAVTDGFGCSENDSFTINYSLAPRPLFALSGIGGCITEDAVLTITRTTADDPADPADDSTPSWTVMGANFSGGTTATSTDIEITVPVPADDGVPVLVEVCLTENNTNCDTEVCKVLSFYNDGQDCTALCNGIYYDACPIEDQPGLVIGCSFFMIEVLELVTVCDSAMDTDGTAINNALQDNGTINCNGASISCIDDGFTFTSEIKLAGFSEDAAGDDTIGGLIGGGLCGVLEFFGIIDDCDQTIAQFLVALLSDLAGGDGAGTLLVADTDGDGQFDTVLGDEANLPVSYTQIFIPNNVDGVGAITVRSIGSFPNPPAGSCGNIQDAVNLLDLLAPLINLIPVAGPIINSVIATAGCGVDIAVSASDDYVVCVENSEPPFFVNCPTVPYMFSQDYSCNIKANWSIPVAGDLCSGEILRFQGVIDTDGDGFAEFDAAQIDAPGVWQTAGPIPGSYLQPGIYSVTYSARGCEDEITECTFEVIITSGNPILTCPNDMVLINDVDQCSTVVTGLTPLQGIGCNTIVNYEIVFPLTSGLPDVTTTSTVVGTHNDPSGTTFPLGTSTVTYTMQIDINGDGDYDDTVDGYEETQMCDYTITIEDGQAPETYCIDIEAFLDEDGEVVVYAANPNDGSTFIDGGSIDNCDPDPSILISKPGGAYAASVTFDCSELGVNFVNLQVEDEAGNISNCIAQVTVNHFLSNYNMELDLAEICLGDNSLTQLDFSEYLTITDENGTFIDPDALPTGLIGTWSITNSNMFPNSFPGTIDPTTGQYTIGTGNGNVLVQYNLALTTGNNAGDVTECTHDVEAIFELYQPIAMGIPTCFCADDAVSSQRVVDLGIVEGGLPPYTIQYEGAGLDIDNDGTPDNLFNLGEFTYEYNVDPASFFSIDLGQLIVNEGETNWSITVLDSRGCEVHRQGQCEPLLDVPSFIGGNSPACFTDGSYALSLSNNFDLTADYIDENINNGNIQINKLLDSQVSNYQINNTELCHNFPSFNADVSLLDVFIRDAANDKIIVNPEALVGLDYRYAGAYEVVLSIPPSEDTQCQYIEVKEIITLYPTFDACFTAPLSTCGNLGTLRIDVNEYNPGYDDLASNLLCRDLNEMSVWELIAPNGIVAGTGTSSALLQEGAVDAAGVVLIEGMADGDVVLNTSALIAAHGAGTYTLNHEIGIDICKTSCTVAFELLDTPTATTATSMPVVCCEDDIILNVATLTGGAAPYTYTWSFIDATMTEVVISPVLSDVGEFTIPVNSLPGGCPLFDSNPNSATLDQVYSFVLNVQDANGCTITSTVQVAVNPNPDMAPEVFDAVFCQSNVAQGEAPIKNTAYSTSTLKVNCGESFDNLDANGNGFIDFGVCGGLTIIEDTDGDGIPNGADGDLNLPDADGDGIPDSADKDLLCIDADLDCIPDLADMDIATTSMDTDGDGIPDEADTDADNDGVLDAIWDTDGDGIADTADVDVDGDGIIDADDADGDNIPDTCDADDNFLVNTTTTGGLDSDMDAIPDVCDIDIDNDGINNAADASDLEGFNNKQVVGCVVLYEGGLDINFDSDGDGIENSADINSFPLGTADTDADGIADIADSDVDGDCVCNTADVEFNFADTDGDGWADNFDADIDNDGVLDNDGDHDNDGLANIADADHPNNIAELDTDNDNIIDAFDLDDDNDGVLDTCDADPLNNADATILAACDCRDTDMDNVLDNYDLDDDNDGIIDEADASHPYNIGEPNADGDDIIDAFDVDTNGDEIADSPDVDSDGDGISDACDTDDDNDGILDEGDADAGGDGIVDFNKVDSDGDGIEDTCDTDDDADQVGDTCDADMNGDNVPDNLFPFTDLDGNGVNDYGDPDGDGIFTGTIAGKTTTCDLDSDNDGIVDFADADIDGDGVLDNGPDTDNDGVNDACDKDDDGDNIVDTCDADHPDNAAAPDFDGDGQIDACDCDDDGDGIDDSCDYLVGGMQVTDLDNDGILDPIDADTPVAQPDADGDGIADFADSDVDGDGIPNAADADFVGTDNDNDGINDAGDADDDNDGVPDACDDAPFVAFQNTDADNDEIAQSQDADQNCDGIIDNGTDFNGDGIADTCDSGDADGDGIVDAVFNQDDNNEDGIIDGIISPDDIDSDGILNTCDTDMDNDGINNACDIDQNPGATDTDGDGIIDACDDAVYPTPTTNWYADEFSTTPLFDNDSDKDGINDSDYDGNPATFDPIAAGLVDPNVPGVYTFWVECVCVPSQKCVGPRVPVTLTILDCPIAEDECTYLLVLKDLGANGWDGASIDVSINEAVPADNYKVTPTDCDLLIIPISTNDGGLIDFTYHNGAKENEHLWCLLDPNGNIALDVNGNPVNFKPFQSPSGTVRVKLDCPTNCIESNEYYIVNTLGNDPINQAWELRDADGTLIADAEFDEYEGLPKGTIVIDTVQLDNCLDYSMTLFEGTGSAWTNATWQIIGTDPDRGTIIPSGAPFAGLFEINAGPVSAFDSEQICTFTIPCTPTDCPADIVEVVADLTNCEISGYVHPTPPTAVVCYPNGEHAIPGPITTISYPSLGLNNLPVGTAIDLPAGTSPVVYEITYQDGQIVRCSSTINVVTNNNPVLVCNDNVNISLAETNLTNNDDCYVIVTPDDVLEAILPCEDQYSVVIFDANGDELSPPNVVGPDQAGQTLQYSLYHLGTDENICWGTLTVEDKLAPIIECFDYQIACNHPDALNEDYTHEESYAAADLPKNISGSLNSGISTTVDVGCTPIGEIVYEVDLNIEHGHTRPADLQLLITAPNGTSITTTIPVDNDDLDVLLGAAYTEYAGTWIFDFLDQNGQLIDNDRGRGSITNVELVFTSGFPKPAVVADCSAVTLSVIDETFVDTDCNQGEWNGALIYRTWQAVDAFGNTSTCAQTIGLKAPTADQITKPVDIAIECGTEELDENGQIVTTQSGGTTYDCFDLTNEQHSLCDVSITFEDNTLPACGNGYKVIRTWTILSWCSGVTHTYEQTIKVEDSTGPAININDIVVNTDPYTCTAASLFLSPAISDACSGIQQITATYTEGGGAYNAQGTLVIVDITNNEALMDIPFGITQIQIDAKDNCGNETSELIDVDVQDSVGPIAICDDELHVSLGSDGTALVHYMDIDEGSYDNCTEVVLYEVRRTNGCLGETPWAETVPFDCCDRDALVTVELRVTDTAGNSNVCWKEVLVEDALAPVITCPGDKTINCDDAAVHAPFGEATAIDNCGAIVTFVDSGELDQCKAGVLTRTFTATDGSDKSVDVICSQKVTVAHVSDFVVQFPSDITLSNCILQDAGEPTITDDDCELLAISSEDLILDVVEDACYKIERTWTIINWCIYDEASATNTNLGFPQPLPRTYRDDDGYFTYVQTIKVLDADAPIITNPGNQTFCDLTDGCEGQADLVLEANDACSDAGALEYTYKIDALNNGDFDIVATGNDASGIYPYGTHLIKWIVEDGCGNTSSTTYLFTIEDCKNPTPVCLNGITLPGMNSNGCVDVWASDLLEYAFDNCSSDELVESTVRIRREGDTAAPQSSITLCCETDGIGNIGVEIWVEDEAGNADFCTTYIGLQDPNSICNGDLSRTLAGDLKTETGDAVEGVIIEITGGATTLDATTENDGYYNFNVPMSNNYTVVPTKDDDPLNGVTTFDLVLMSQHILGYNEFSNPYQLIAADVNNDGNITTFDIVQTRQLILYVIQDFPSNTSWRFVDADYVFPDATNPWMEAFPEVIAYQDLVENKMEGDFISIKIGDVNGDMIPNNLLETEDRSKDGSLILEIEDRQIEAGETFEVNFGANQFENYKGYQFAMDFDATAASFAGAESGKLNVTEANFGANLLSEGVLTTSWNVAEAISLENGEVLFTLSFVANQAITLSDFLSVSNKYTTAEAYTEDKLMDVALVYTSEEGTLASGNNFELYQNKPNPFAATTNIAFYLPQSTKATLSVYEVSGKVLHTIEGDYAKGYHQVVFDKKDFQSVTGVLYYRLDTDTDTDTKKMIVLK